MAISNYQKFKKFTNLGYKSLTSLITLLELKIG